MGLHNLAKELSETLGTANAVLSGAVEGFNSFVDAGVTDGESVNYGIITFDVDTHRPTDSEVGIGIWDEGGLTLQRTTVVDSTNGGAKIELTGLSWVFIPILAQDVQSGNNGLPGSFGIFKYSSTSNVSNSSSVTLPLDTELVDADNLVTLASNQLTFLSDGWFDVDICIRVEDADGFGNGYLRGVIGGNYDGAAIQPETQFDTAADGTGTLAIFNVRGPISVESGEYMEVNFDNFSGGTVVASIKYVKVMKLS